MSDTLRWFEVVNPLSENRLPEWVNRSWKGVQMPDFGLVSSSQSICLATGKLYPADPTSILFPRNIALACLSVISMRSTRWYRRNTINCALYTFKRAERQIVTAPRDVFRSAARMFFKPP